jgi:predicted dehydrogenase
MPVTYRSGDIVSPYLYFHEPLQVQDDHFVDCVRTGTRPRTPGERGLDIVRVLEAADAASRSGHREPVRAPVFG